MFTEVGLLSIFGTAWAKWRMTGGFFFHKENRYRWRVNAIIIARPFIQFLLVQVNNASEWDPGMLFLFFFFFSFSRWEKQTPAGNGDALLLTVLSRRPSLALSCDRLAESFWLLVDALYRVVSLASNDLFVPLRCLDERCNYDDFARRKVVGQRQLHSSSKNKRRTYFGFRFPCEKVDRDNKFHAPILIDLSFFVSLSLF